MKTRFSPSPTGQMHLGNVRTALFSFLLTRGLQVSGTFLLRIEDTDKARSTEIFTENLKKDLTWLELNWDEGPFFQSARQDIYQKYYRLLEENKAVYPCFCSEEQLALSRKIQLSSGRPPRYAGTCRHLTENEIAAKKSQGLQAALRFKVSAGENIIFEDIIKGIQQFKTDDIGDFIIRRTDGSASFFFCNAIDDALMNITHAIRGEDHLSNTPRQLMILKKLNLCPPAYGHLPLILNEGGDKLSKREGSQHLESLRVQGYLPIAIHNYLARLGHYYKQTHLMSLQELSEKFSLSHVGKTPAHFDEDQLKYWQKQAVMQLDFSQFWAWINLPANYAALIAKNKQSVFTTLIQGNIILPHEALQWTKILFLPNNEFTPEAIFIIKKAGKEFLKILHQSIFQEENYKSVISQISLASGLKGKVLFQPLRIILTGQLEGPSLEILFDLLDKKQLTAKILQAENAA